MREVREGDFVFHFVDNQKLQGVSVGASQADDTFTGQDGTEWSGRPSYRIVLRDYRQLTPAIDRSEFLGSARYRSRISDILERHRGLFFNSEFNLNQGSYLTEAPLELVQLWDEIYQQKSGTALLPGIDLARPAPSDNATALGRQLPFDSKCVAAFEEALHIAGLIVSHKLVIQILASLISKRLLLLCGLATPRKSRLRLPRTACLRFHGWMLLARLPKVLSAAWLEPKVLGREGSAES